MAIIWGISAYCFIMMATSNYVEGIYQARVATGNLTYNDIGLAWAVVCSACAIAAFVLGLKGKLPGTK